MQGARPDQGHEDRPARRATGRIGSVSGAPNARRVQRRVHVDRTGLSPPALAQLSTTVLDGQARTAHEAGLLSHTAKKRRQIDGYIDTIGQSLSGGRNSGSQSDLAVLLMMQQSRDAAGEERRLAAEERRLEREEKRQQEQAAKDQAREEREEARRYELNVQLMAEKREHEERRRAEDQRNARAEHMHMLLFAKICGLDTSTLNN